MKLDDVGLTDEAETKRTNRQPTCDAHTAAGFIRAIMGFVVDMPTLDGEPVFRPQSFDMDKRALTFAE